MCAKYLGIATPYSYSWNRIYTIVELIIDKRLHIIIDVVIIGMENFFQ